MEAAHERSHLEALRDQVKNGMQQALRWGNVQYNAPDFLESPSVLLASSTPGAPAPRPHTTASPRVVQQHLHETVAVVFGHHQPHRRVVPHHEPEGT